MVAEEGGPLAPVVAGPRAQVERVQAAGPVDDVGSVPSCRPMELSTESNSIWKSIIIVIIINQWSTVLFVIKQSVCTSCRSHRGGSGASRRVGARAPARLARVFMPCACLYARAFMPLCVLAFRCALQLIIITMPLWPDSELLLAFMLGQAQQGASGDIHLRRWSMRLRQPTGKPKHVSHLTDARRCYKLGRICELVCPSPHPLATPPAAGV